MTNRQKKRGVTEYGYRCCQMGMWLKDSESFLAKAATIRKGQYSGKEIAREWFEETCPDMADILAEANWTEIQGRFYALSVTHPEHFIYTSTLGLDVLTVR